MVPVAVELLRLATAGSRPGLEFVDLPWGGDYYLETGRMMPDDAPNPNANARGTRTTMRAD